MTSVVACEPELPPLEMMSGMKSARTTAAAISPSKYCMALAVSISPRKSSDSQRPRLRIISSRPTSRYGASRASVPPIFWMSSVASSWTTWTTSSTVTTPFMRPSASTTGTATRP